jgi:hypothetical protein
MTKPIVTIHNVETNEIEVREMNAKEIAELEANKKAGDAVKAAEAKLEAAKEAAQAKLAALGLTTDDLKALGL